jgi:hypothetical protein
VLSFAPAQSSGRETGARISGGADCPSSPGRGTRSSFDTPSAARGGGGAPPLARHAASQALTAASLPVVALGPAVSPRSQTTACTSKSLVVRARCQTLLGGGEPDDDVGDATAFLAVI